MGRFSSVQAYADNNSNVRSVPYEQATGSQEPKKGAVKPEKVNNPYGSTAGAGSGEFHVYRHARAREMARWKQLNEEEKKKELDSKFESQVAQYEKEAQERTAKKRKKRQKQKEAKQRKKNLQLAGIVSQEGPSGQEVDEEEFTYEPVSNIEEPNETRDDKEGDSKAEAAMSENQKDQAGSFPNDGSFLETMKRRLAEDAEEKKADANAPSED